MSNKRINPINRNNRWFDESDFKLELEMGREAIESDLNFIVVLFRVNREQTQFDELYGESTSSGIRYYPPVELKVVPIIGEAENKVYNSDSGSLRYLQDGQLTFGIYSKQLEELKTDISYGDYIGYQINEREIRYFNVVNDGKKNFDNKHTIMGYKGVYRTIVCAAVDNNEFTSI